MKKITIYCVLILASLILLPAPAAANTINTDVPALATNPDVVITAFGGSSSLDFAEIFNQTDKPIDITGWGFSYTTKNLDGSCEQTSLAKTNQSGWLLPGRYFSFINGPTVAGSDNEVYFQPVATSTTACPTAQLSEISLIDADSKIIQVINPAIGSDSIWVHHQRSNKSLTRDVSGIFADDYKSVDEVKCRDDDPDNQVTLCSQPLYNPPADLAGLKILEILPHARDCSPLDNSSLDCADYVKLYNSSKSAIDLSYYRLRVGHKSEDESVSNTFDFNSTLAPGKYFTLATRDDSKPLTLTDSGNYVWLEDAAGLKIYSPVIKYPSASSEKYIGASWAIDNEGNWQWTSTPEPFKANKLTPLKISQSPSVSASTSSLKPCSANQFRNPETNRCKLKVTASTLVPCGTDQFRNVDTNRCDSVSAAASSLTPCDPDQYRNPATNRCKLKSAASSSLEPCQPGWTRNPETNRCRKGAISAASAPKIQDVKGASTTKSHTGWIIALIAAITALGYAAYEWRQELLTVFKKLKIHH